MADGGSVGRTVPLEDWADVMVAGDRHVVGRAGTRWIVTGAVKDVVDGIARVHWGGGAYRLGRQATALCPQAVAAVRAMLGTQCMDAGYIQRVLDGAERALRSA